MLRLRRSLKKSDSIKQDRILGGPEARKSNVPSTRKPASTTRREMEPELGGPVDKAPERIGKKEKKQEARLLRRGKKKLRGWRDRGRQVRGHGTSRSGRGGGERWFRKVLRTKMKEVGRARSKEIRAQTHQQNSTTNGWFTGRRRAVLQRNRSKAFGLPSTSKDRYFNYKK